MDDLLNQDIRKQEKEKQSKTSINKYIEDFLGFITKSIDMFTSMSFKDRLKCFLEQVMLVLIEAFILIVFYFIFSNIIENVVRALPIGYSFADIILSIFDAAYVIFGLVAGLTLIIHVFKVRYLDYYEIVKSDDAEILKEKPDLEIKESKQITIEKPKAKIIIRNPNHSDYKFISGALKIMMLGIKCFLLIISAPILMSLVALVVALVLSFMIAKTGIFFIGVLLSLLSAVSINTIILVVLLNFILNRKNNSKAIIILFVSSLLLLGVGIGIGTIGFTEFKYIDDINNEIFQTTETTLPMNDNLVIDNMLNEAELVEEEREDVKIVIKHTKYIKIEIRENDNNHIAIFDNFENDDVLTKMREQLKDINNKKIINYTKYKIFIYASKSNLEKLEKNKEAYIKQLDEQRIYDEIHNLEQIIREKDNKIAELEENLSEKQVIIDSYER